ncbi:MAG: PilN domain-containing protein [Gemmatimonadota bacterium]
MIRINLVRGKRKKRREFSVGSLYLVVPVLVLAGVFVFHQAMVRKIAALESDIQKATMRIEVLKKEIGEVEKFKARKAELQKKVDIISNLQAGRTGPVRVLDAISTLIPENSWIDKLSYTGDRIAVDGIAMNNIVVADFMTALSRSGLFRDVVLGSADQTTVAGMKLVKFNLTFHAVAR